LEEETPPEESPPYPTSSSSSPWSRGSSPSLEYGFVPVSWSISFMDFIVTRDTVLFMNPHKYYVSC
jgi:hypothetical protein